MRLKIYLLTRVAGYGGYDSYDGAVVCAKKEEDAFSLHDDPSFRVEGDFKCIEIGIANKDQVRGVILDSFNAG